MAGNLIPLEDIRIASPCSASWEAMDGGDRVRFCRHCEKNVYNLSGMSRQEAEQLVRDMEGRLCVRLSRRRDGTVLTDDCPIGFRAARRRLLVHIAGIAALLGGLLGLRVERSVSTIQGAMAFPSPPLAPPSGSGAFPTVRGEVGDFAIDATIEDRGSNPVPSPRETRFVRNLRKYNKDYKFQLHGRTAEYTLDGKPWPPQASDPKAGQP